MPNRRLAYRHDVDFVPGVATYAVDTVVELVETPAGVRMVLRFDAMHDDVCEVEAPAWLEHTVDLVEHASLVRRQVDHAVGDHHVDALVVHRQGLEVAFAKVHDVVQAGLLGR